jgi:hypothetical protein
MAMGTITFNYFQVFAFFFFLLLLTFQKGTIAIGFSTCYDGNCLLLRNTCSQCLIVNLTTSFHIVVQMFVYTCTTEVCVRDCLENSTLLEQPLAQETIKIQSVACRS